VPPRAASEALQPAHRDVQGMHVLDPHWKLCEVREALFAPPIRDLLAAFHAARPRLFRSRLFVRSPGTSLHRDDATCGLAPGVVSCTVCIALERIGPGQGGPVYVPRSHWLPPARLGALRAPCAPCERALPPDDIDVPIHPARLHGLLPECFHAEAGDAIVWDARLLHGSAPLRDRAATRCSVVGHFCSSETLPPIASGLRAECGGDYCSACYGED
jgi:ectoine hydroxylase-related dioxygenase (phytanoyl-CoA dioxygenase family)